MITAIEQLKKQITTCREMNIPLDIEKQHPLYQQAIQELDQPPTTAPVWETPPHREVDPFDADYEDVMQQMAANDAANDAANGANVPPPAQPPAPPVLCQPDANGEFPTALAGALWMAGTYDIPQIPLRGKIPFLPDWPGKATTDPVVIRAWDTQYPGCNYGSAALGEHFTFEADKPADGVPTIRERFKAQGYDFTAGLVIESSPGKTHNYYKSTPGVDNIAQNAVLHKDFTVRVHK